MSMLYLIPTPIGNLEDITLRAIRVLKEVDLILSEDTRNSGKLLKQYNIQTPLKSHHMHNEHREVESLIQRIKKGETLALISDAGTPGISDPGFLPDSHSRPFPDRSTRRATLLIRLFFLPGY